VSAAAEKAGKLTIAAAAAVTSAVVGSLFGDTGTLTGVACGTIVSGAAAEVYGWVVDRGRRRLSRLPRHVAARVAAGIAVTAVALPLGLQAAEAAAHKPLHAIMTGAAEKGSTFGGTTTYTPAPGPSPTGLAPGTLAPTYAGSTSPSPSPAYSSTIPATPGPGLSPSPFPDVSSRLLPDVTPT
jgi:hypothetical protein